MKNDIRRNLIDAVRYCTEADIAPISLFQSPREKNAVFVECDSPVEALTLQQVVSQAEGANGAVVCEGTERTVRIDFDNAKGVA